MLNVLVTGLNPSVELVCFGIIRSPAWTMCRDFEDEDRASPVFPRRGTELSVFLREDDEELFVLKVGECVKLR